jgi:hypothetical protein
MRYLYFSPVVAALSLALAVPGRLSAQAADTSKAAASPSSQTVTCKDGTSAQKGQGACSHHGGYVRMVNCKDGTMSKKGQGACSHHGGVVTHTATSNKAKAGHTKTTAAPGKAATAAGDSLKRGDSTSSPQ